MEKLKVGILYNVPLGKYKNQRDLLSEEGVLAEVDAVCQVLEEESLEYDLLPLRNMGHALIDKIRRIQPQVVLNLAESFNGDSGKEMLLPAMLDLLKIPYTGSDALTLGLCLDKVKTKAVLKEAGLNIPQYIMAANSDFEPGNLRFPLIVKPMKEDASLGVSKESVVYDKEQLMKQVTKLINDYAQPALVEEYVEGREFNISVTGNNPCRVLPVSELDFSGLSPSMPKICGYKAKWVTNSNEYQAVKVICPARLSPQLAAHLENVAKAAYEATGCRDYARIDVRVNEKEKIYVLEVNPNPDISPQAGLARSVREAGSSYNDFIKDVLIYAWDRRADN